MKPPTIRPSRSLAIAVGMLVLLFSGCSGNLESPPVSTSQGIGNPMEVVTTVSPITSLVENVGGTAINIQGIIPEGVNSHTYDPAPSIAKLMSEADLIVLNGLFLEEPALKMAMANKKPDAVILTLADNVISREEWVYDSSFPISSGHPNPHLWTDPFLALRYAELVLYQLRTLDPSNLDYYNTNYAKLKSRVEDLNRRTIIAMDTIPPQNRKLLTYHDSFPFFASRYGLDLIAAVQPSDFTEPSARDAAKLIDQIRETKVPAIFGSAIFPSPAMDQIAKEAGTNFVDQLRDDDLPGEPGAPHHTYLGMMVSNVRIIVDALGGDSHALDDFPSSLVFEGESRAIYPQ